MHVRSFKVYMRSARNFQFHNQHTLENVWWGLMRNWGFALCGVFSLAFWLFSLLSSYCTSQLPASDSTRIE